MSSHLRLVVIGGSGASTPELFDAVAAWPGGEKRRPPLEIVLQGRSEQKLAVVAAACRDRLPATAGDVSVITETSLEQALRGADAVLIQVRVGGLDARIFDESFPRAFDIPGEETMGPGGFANAVRTIPALAQVWDTLKDVAPDSFIINLTNPSGIVSAAATAHTGLPIVSVCDGPVTFTNGIAEATGRDVDAIRRTYVGLNHAGFWIDADEAVMTSALGASKGIDAADVEALAALPSPYLRYYLHPDRELELQRATPESRAQVLKRLEAEMLDQYGSHVAAGEHKRRGALWYGVSIVPLIDAFVYGSDESMVLGSPNHGAVEWAPDDAMVELPTRVAAGGILERRKVVEVPPAARAMLAAHAAFEMATAHALEGARTPHDVAARKEPLVAALASNPLVPSADMAADLVDEILRSSPS